MVIKKEFDKDKEMHGSLMKIGFSNKEAKILAYMLCHKEALSKKIEHDTGLRQPEANKCLKTLRKTGLLKREMVRVKSKGRPLHKYSLKRTMQNTKEFLIGIAEKQVAEQMVNRENLKKQLSAL